MCLKHNMYTHLVTLWSVWVFSRHLRPLWCTNDVFNVGLLCNFAVLGYDMCPRSNAERSNSWFLPKICIMIGSTILQSLMCICLCVVELLRHNRRRRTVTSPVHGLLIPHVLLLRWSWKFTNRYTLKKNLNGPSMETTPSPVTDYHV